MDCALGTTAKVNYSMKVAMACKDFALKKGWVPLCSSFFLFLCLWQNY